MVLAQYNWGANWSMNADGTLLACWSQDPDGQAGSTPMEVFNQYLVPVLDFSSTLAGLRCTPYQPALEVWRLDDPLNLGGAAHETAVMMGDIRSLFQPDGQAAPQESRLMCLEWSGLGDLLALTPFHLYFKLGPGAAWQHVGRLPHNLFYAVGGPPRLASWTPDGRSIMLVGPRRVALWLCDSQTCLTGFSETVPLGLRHALARCSPDGRVLAVLNPQQLVLQRTTTHKVLLSVRYPTAHAPAELCWSAAGDKLMLARGGAWRMLCFGRQGSTLQPGSRLMELLAEVSTAANSEAEDVRAFGTIGCYWAFFDGRQQDI